MKKIVLSAFLAATFAYAGSNSLALDLELLEKGKTDMTYESFFDLAKSGDIDAQTMLGEMYLEGIIVQKDYEKAFFWLAKAANSDNIKAQYLLGTMYENGLHVAKNIDRAVSWYKKAASRGDVLAQFNLALIYKEGKGGIQKSMPEAFKWLKMVENSQKSFSSNLKMAKTDAL